MKSFKLIIAFLFISQITFAQSIVNLINRADAFFDTMDKGKFEEAHGFFDESVKDKISADELKLFWLRLGNSLGTYESVDGAQNKTQGEYFQVTLNCVFTKGSQGFTFIFNKSEKLVGFFVAQTTQEAVYVAPAYADTNLYTEKEVQIKFGGGQMAGMLTIPKGATNFPLVVLVHGSGPSDMDGTVGPNKPLKDLASGLAAKGIATLRYVKRSMVYPNSFVKTFTVKEEVIDDALEAIAVAKSTPGVNKAQIYLLGHSLGGMLAPRIAGLAPDLAGIILAAAPARKMADLVAEQNKYLYLLSGDTTAATKQRFQATTNEIDRSRLLKLGDIAPDSIILSAPASYWIDLNNYDQVASAKKFPKKILVIQGENDFQVSMQDYNMWRAGLAANKNASFKVYPDLNHLLTSQKEKGTGVQYRVPANVSPKLIEDIAVWIKGK
ncbi:MAG: alpha/beta fold hydrolase [Daejeonella sp.]|uniref:alpha/beta fold hydrolase n=1 Tax=Daejeonella sp. JGW-45 TaxID=3034148 RepID=UPI0023EAEE09|nr:alpha/beta fold hydrolase [Daejeonella sp. JGW-45]